MFQPQPTPFSPFSTYGLNISPQPQPPPPLLDFNNFHHNHNHTTHPHNHNHNQNLNHHNHDHDHNHNNHNSFSNTQSLHQHQHQHPQSHSQSQSHSHSHSHSNSHSHPHPHPLNHTHTHSHSQSHAQQQQQQRSNSLSHSSPSACTPPTTAAVVDNLSSIVVASQSGQGTTAGRGLGNTLQQFQQRHPQQPIFNPVNSSSANSNPNLTGTLNLPHNTNTNSSLPPLFAHHSQQQYKMEDNGVGGINDMEAQEALAREFQPALEGPLVGEKKSSLAIVEEYAKADPIYVSKTSALPQKYSHYRPVLGDGNCGWRAAGFSYFETLLRMRNRGQVEEELARILSLNSLLTTAGGFDAWIFEDMVEETTTLLRDMADLMDTSIQAAESLILDRFNDSEISNAIVYHFRLLASSWLKANPQNYQGFIPDGGGVDQYRKEWLEPPNQEIDHLGMTLLIDVLLKPTRFSVEIVYLDRSEGTQVNSHMFQAEDSNGQPTNPGGPIIYLLYRPGHYDILYKDLVRQSIDMSSNIQVNRATNFTHQHSTEAHPPMNPYQTMDLLLSIPGVSFASPYPNFGTQYQSPMSQPFAPAPSTALSPMSPTGNSVSTPQSASSVTSLPNRSTFTSINTPTPIITSPHPFKNTPISLPIHTLPPPTPHTIPSPISLGIPAASFRPSKYEWAISADLHEGPVPSFQTSTFKNSHYNTAHYNNPNFQPEEWTPEEDGLGVGSKGGGGGGYGGWARKRSS
ncbi:putative ubiquitin thioesterase protein [Botrytis fragariae]|uniref:ubiquitinyl hydrolase 1 n=1 Tax=Botrytis fragariae TaxID=1964551 RepID=A0A8H6AHU9_9HELO|nr:putative ubiquitin thioesterase protein [Botrytis fragariae]KAF5867892.1 putative ubiquitin thioesterase protein [Botrytis fragariae]